MKKIFTLIIVCAFATALLAQNPYVNAAKTGLANSFDTEADVLNEYVAWGHWFNGFAENMDTSAISWVDGAMKIEAKLGWDYAKAYFLVSPDLDETIDITNKYRVSFKYKNLAPADIALAISFRNIVGEDTLAYGGEIWLEGADVTYGSDDWVTVDKEFTLENFDLAKVVALEIYVDGKPDGSVIIDDLVFGDYSETGNPYVNAERTGLYNGFDTEADVLNEFMAWGHSFNGFAENTDTSEISWVDEAMKIEAKQGWDYAKAWFLISPNLDEFIDITNSYRVKFRYKNLQPTDIALAVSFRNLVDGDTLAYGGEIWLEGADVTYGSNDWVTVDKEFTLENFDLAKVTALEFYVDGQPDGSVIIDDVVFGDQTTSIEDQIGSSVSEFKVFPNPAYGFIRVEGTGMSNEVNIFNTIGQNVMHIRNRNQIDISSLSKGFYFVVVESKGVRETHKLLVK
jgi:hypothetical protein